MELNIATKEDLEKLGENIIQTFLALLKERNIEQKERLFSNKEAYSYLKVCAKTLQNYRDDGLIRFSQVGRKIIYTQKDLDAFLEKYKKETILIQIKKQQNAKH